MTKKEIVVLEDLLGANKKTAENIRQALTKQGILAINLISSPGAGKTSLLERLSEYLEPDYKMAVIEGDIETERDADRIRAKGIRAWQIMTGGACHLDANMIGKLFPEISTDIHFLFIENVGNLVCPASFDLGEHVRIVLLSSPEGDDKPKKYPKAFVTSNCLVISKADLIPPLPFNVQQAKEEALTINPKLDVFITSSTADEGIRELADYLIGRFKDLQSDA